MSPAAAGAARKFPPRPPPQRLYFFPTPPVQPHPLRGPGEKSRRDIPVQNFRRESLQRGILHQHFLQARGLAIGARDNQHRRPRARPLREQPQKCALRSLVALQPRAPQRRHARQRAVRHRRLRVHRHPLRVGGKCPARLVNFRQARPCVVRARAHRENCLQRRVHRRELFRHGKNFRLLERLPRRLMHDPLRARRQKVHQARGGGVGHFSRRGRDDQLRQSLRRQLRRRVKHANGLQFIAKKIQARGRGGVEGIHINQPAAHGVLPRRLAQRLAIVAQFVFEPVGQFAEIHARPRREPDFPRRQILRPRRRLQHRRQRRHNNQRRFLPFWQGCLSGASALG